MYPLTATESETPAYVIFVFLCKILCVYVCVCFNDSVSLCSMSKWAEGSGRHVQTVSTPNFIVVIKVSFACQLLDVCVFLCSFYIE